MWDSVRRHAGALSLAVAGAAMVLAATLPVRPLQAAELIMLEQDGCHWCEMWDEQIAPIYPKTTEGKRAPLRRVDLFAPLPEDLTHLSMGRYTPTFILVHEGEEIGRIRGYPGEDFFWGLLEQMMAKLPAETRPPGPKTDG